MFYSLEKMQEMERDGESCKGIRTAKEEQLVGEVSPPLGTDLERSSHGINLLNPKRGRRFLSPSNLRERANSNDIEVGYVCGVIMTEVIHDIQRSTVSLKEI